MKKFISAALFGTMVLTATAADFVVYGDGSLNPVLTVYPWWNASSDFATANPDGEENVFCFKAQDGGADASMGIFVANAEMPTGKLHSATLNFDWYATGTGKYTVRLTAMTEENYSFEVDAENADKWNHTSLNVAEVFPTIAQQWDDYENNGEGYIFSVILTAGVEESAIYFSNITYTNVDEDWKAPEKVTYPAPTSVPVPTQAADEVVSLFGNHYTPATTFGIGNWGQLTHVEDIEIEGNPVEYLTNFNYLGWELTEHVNVEGYTYMHVDMYTPDGETFGFTPISPGQEKAYIASEVKKGEWNSYDVPLTHWNNVDFADLFQIKFDQGQGGEYYIANVYFWKDENIETPEEPEIPDTPIGDNQVCTGKATGTYEQTMDDVTTAYPYTLNYSITYNTDATLTFKADFEWSNGEPIGMVAGSVFVNNVLNDFTDASDRTVTTTETYTLDTVIPINFYIPVALGVFQYQFDYTVGSSVRSGVENVASENAPVEYYNLQGQRVSNPENGIFIRRRGNNAVKVIL